VEVHAALVFDGPVRDLLHAYKFHGQTPLAPRLARELTAVMVPLRLDAVVPVPLHWRRRWRRGHDQTAGLAAALRNDLPRLPVHRILRRRRATSPQVGAGGAERRRNVVGAFAVRPSRGDAIRGLRVGLLDDVVTTVSTLAAAAEPLRLAGAGRVIAIALAAAPRSLPGA